MSTPAGAAHATITAPRLYLPQTERAIRLRAADAAAEGRQQRGMARVISALQDLKDSTGEGDGIALLSTVADVIEADGALLEAVGDDVVTALKEAVLRMHSQMLDGNAQAAAACAGCTGSGEGAYSGACWHCGGSGDAS